MTLANPVHVRADRRPRRKPPVVVQNQAQPDDAPEEKIYRGRKEVLDFLRSQQALASRVDLQLEEYVLSGTVVRINSEVIITVNNGVKIFENGIREHQDALMFVVIDDILAARAAG